MNDCCACDCGRLVVIASERSISALSRSSSLAGNAGLRATSATSAIISGANSASASPPIVVSSEPTPTLSDPPMLAASSAICSPLRVVVPSTIMSPTRSASHTSSAASSTFPTRMTSSTATFGTVPYQLDLEAVVQREGLGRRQRDVLRRRGLGRHLFLCSGGHGKREPQQHRRCDTPGGPRLPAAAPCPDGPPHHQRAQRSIPDLI